MSEYFPKPFRSREKTEVNNLDIGKLVPIPADLSKLSNAVKNDVVKKTEYGKLVTKVNNIDTSQSVLKNNYNTKVTELEIKFLILVILLKKLITILKLRN